jgi:hypothetical protein
MSNEDYDEDNNGDYDEDYDEDDNVDCQYLANLFKEGKTNIIRLLQNVIKYMNTYNIMTDHSYIRHLSCNCFKETSFFNEMNKNIDSIDIIKKIYHVLLIKGYFVSSIDDFIKSYIKYINEMLMKLEIRVGDCLKRQIVSYLQPEKQYEINSFEFQNKIIKEHTRNIFWSYQSILVFEYIFHTFLNQHTIENYIYIVDLYNDDQDDQDDHKLSSLLNYILYSHIKYPPYFLIRIFTYFDSIKFDYNNPSYYSLYNSPIHHREIDIIKLLLERKVTFQGFDDEIIIIIIDRHFSLYQHLDINTKNRKMCIKIYNNDKLLKLIFKFYYENQSKLTTEMRTLLNKKYRTSFFVQKDREHRSFIEEITVDEVYSEIDIDNIIKYLEVFEYLKTKNFDFTKYKYHYVKSTLNATPSKEQKFGYNKHIRILYPELHQRLLDLMS